MDFTFKNIHEFNDYFKDEKTCYDLLEQQRWNGCPICPHCGSYKYYTVKSRSKFKDIPSYRCANRDCDLPFTVRTKSIFEGSKIELRKWFQAIYEISIAKKGISSVELAARIGISQKSAWFVNHRLRVMLQETNPKLLKDVVAADESFFGGKSKNKHKDKRIPHSQGRSGKGKTTVFGVRDYLGNVRAQVVPNAEGENMVPLVKKWVERGAIVVTDEWRGYNELSRDYYHVKVQHSEGQYVTGCFTSNGVENFWSIFKRGVIGTFHNLSAQHLQKYTNEFSFRYNNKGAKAPILFEKIIGKVNTERETYKELTETRKKLFSLLNENNI